MYLWYIFNSNIVIVSFLKQSSTVFIHAVQRESHVAQHATHNHNQAHSKQRTIHTLKHDMLPQHHS